MTPKTIMLANSPSLLRDLLADLLKDHPEVPVVIRDHEEGGLIAASVAAKAGVVVAANGDPAALDAIDPALGWAASLSVLAIAPDGRSACIHRIRLETQVVKDVTQQRIVAALDKPCSGETAVALSRLTSLRSRAPSR